AAPQIAKGTLEQATRQLQASGNLERVAHAKLADLQLVGRAQRLHVEFHRRVLRPVVRESVGFQVAQVSGNHGPAADLIELVKNGTSQSGALGRIGPGTQLVEEHEALAIGQAQNGG